MSSSAGVMIDVTSYSKAKKALNPSDPDRVVCREEERHELESYLVNCFENKTAMSIYVNGQPGTGKTLLISHVLNDLKQDYKFKMSVHNCMALKNVQTLYKAVAQELNTSCSLAGGGDTGTLTPRRAAANKENLAKSIETQLKSMKNHFVLVLDEIDQIEKIIKSDTDLYRIFDWPYQNGGSKLILIGIANSLDFTDKFLPRLELKPECKPKIIKFLPYGKEDIIKIVKDRLNSVNTPDSPAIIDDKALMLCASKIASTTGDIRKVLDICRRAIEAIEQEMKFNGGGATKSVGIAHMMRIFNEVNPMTNASLDRNTMPLMQKLLLCTILLCTKQGQTREITFSKLYARFKKICEDYSTMIDSESELINLCTLMQDNGLVEVKKAKEVRSYKFSLRIDEEELRDRLQDEEFMNNLLSKY